MVSFGSKALPLRRLVGIMGDEDNSHKRSRKKMGMSRKPDKQSNSFDANVNKNGSGRGSQRQSDWETQRAVVRYYMISFFNDGF